ncbi:AbrB family transcriptional regulator [Sporosarcina koreensis]|uniref:AbrB family transcriptional regulator n=1 Tax=Bacillales TaxID=1385 RepID=UPI0007520531|nr:AbrB family transcriptional regulator [Sporosarcina koreensis]
MKMKPFLLIAIASIGALIGYILKLPIGILIGSFLAIAIAQILGMGAAPLSKNKKQSVQMVIGGFVGLKMNHEQFPYLLDLLIPGILAAVAHLLTAFLFALLLSKYFQIDWITAICGSIPAGMSEASTIADEFGADTQTVMLIHLFRVSLLVTILPTIITLLL